MGNMPIKSEGENGDSHTTTFEKTPRMSSYLLAFVIGELHKKTARTKSGVEVNVWATPAQNENTLDFALDIAARSIDFMMNISASNIHCQNPTTSPFLTFPLAQWKTGD